MTKRQNLALLISMFGSALVMVVAIYLWSNSYLDKQSQKKIQANQLCSMGRHTEYQVQIIGDIAVPEHISGILCDTLTITNKDEQVKLMAFGKHDKHKAYDGVTEKALRKGQSLKVTLVQAGTFEFHDHIGDKSKGTFNVNPTN